MIYVALFLFPAFVLLLWVLRHDTLKRGKEEEALDNAKAVNEKISDRALTDDDLINRLRQRASNERNNSSKP